MTAHSATSEQDRPAAEAPRALILAGGLGTRLRTAVSGVPKVLASVGGRPFLELLIRQLSSQGIRRIVLSTGYLADQVEQAFGDGSGLGVHIEYSVESAPQGTGGALQLAQRYLLNESEFLVLNGDSFLEIDFRELLAFHREHRGAATMAVTPAPDVSRYGTVQMNASGRVTRFAEKGGETGRGFINAGIYVCTPEILSHLPEGPASLERDVFPALIDRGIFAFEQHGIFIDIGIPADYERAQEISEKLAFAAGTHTAAQV